jgi:hypothetical protein
MNTMSKKLAHVEVFIEDPNPDGSADSVAIVRDFSKIKSTAKKSKKKKRN